MSWKDTLPQGLFERALRTFIMLVLAICAGFGMGLLYARNDFMNGATYMQRAYTDGGLVSRVVVR